MLHSEKTEASASNDIKQDSAVSGQRTAFSDLLLQTWGPRPSKIDAPLPQEKRDQKDKKEAPGSNEKTGNQKVIEIGSEAQFKDIVLNGKGAAVLSLHAPWCAPSKQMQGSMDKLAKDLNGTAPVYSLDINAHPWAQKILDGKGIPQVLTYKDGKVAAQQVGLTSYEELKKQLGLEVKDANSDSKSSRPSDSNPPSATDTTSPSKERKEASERLPREISSKEDFDKLVLGAKSAVVVEFGSSSCGPSHAMRAEVDKLSKDLSGIPVYRVDVSKSDWAQGYAKMTPTVAIFENGKSVKLSEGMTRFPELKNRLTEHLKNAN